MGTSGCGNGGGAGLTTGAGTKVDITLKLAQLQNLVKRDPSGYREDYEAQIQRLKSECGILTIAPQGLVDPATGSTTNSGGGRKATSKTSSSGGKLEELIQFAAATASSSYKGKESNRIAAILIGLLVGEQPDIDDDDDDDDDDDIKGNKNGPKTKKNTNKNMHNNKQLHTMTTMLPSAALQLPRDVRKTCVSALILMRNKGALEPLRLLELFFRLMAVVPDKTLREILYKHMVNDIRNINKKGKRDDKVNRAIQSFLHRVVATHGQEKRGNETAAALSCEENATDIAAKRATDMVCELYRRQVWTDDRTVAILATAVESKNTTVASRAMRFFLNIEDKMALDSAEKDEHQWDASQKINYHSFSRKTKTRINHVKRQLTNRNKQQRKREGVGSDDWMDVRDDDGVEIAKKLYPAIELLRDPSGLAESVLKRLKNPKSSIPYTNKLLMMNFVTRLVGNHELMLLNLYPFLQKYMGGHQRDVTGILAYSVQACHENVPPDEVYGILKTIAHNFVTERCSEEQIAVGINAIRAICSRVPSVLSIEDSKESLETNVASATFDVEAFVRDIAAFSTHRDRSVSIAGKSYQNFIREKYPTLLQGKNRGLKGSALHKQKTKPMRFGEQKVSHGVEGADLLLEYEGKRAAYMKEQEKLEQQQEEEDNASDVEVDMIGMEDEEEDEDEEAPDLVVLDPNEGAAAATGDDTNNDEEDGGGEDEEEELLDLSKMTQDERNKLKAQISSTRIFSAGDFVKMKKLVEREERARRDPREAARRKRAIARGEEFDELSEDDFDSDDDDEDDEIRIKGAVNPDMIMAEAKRKRKSKAEKLQKILSGRDAFETKMRAGGSTNTEKERKKNFLMTKSGRRCRTKGRGKGGLSEKRGHGGMDGKKKQIGHEAKKRRRKV
jgi:protein SDA1